MNGLRRVPPFVWTLAMGALVFAAGTALFVWASNAPNEEMERLPWIAKVVLYVAGTPLGWFLLVGPVAFIAMLQFLQWLQSHPQG